MPRNFYEENSQGVVNNLRIWSEKYNVSSDVYVAELQSALEEKRQIGYLGNLDPFIMLPKPTSIRSRKLIRMSRLISIFRNVLIFTPVALTWYAIGEATSAFQTYVTTGGAATANFLEFWQNGYGILDPKWRISEVAFFDFLIIMVIIGLSLASGSIQHRALHIDYRESEIIESERFDMALEISRLLHENINPSIPQINSQIVTSIRALARSTQELNKATLELKKSLAMGEKIKKSGVSLENTSRKTVQASASIVKQVKILQKLSNEQRKRK